MDKIYQNASATIVACAGSDCEYGLPGVGKLPRIQQLLVKTPNTTLISSFPPLSTAIQRSVWEKRGWTYQEAVLSKRLIFFTDYQVYTLCSESGGQFWCESFELSQLTTVTEAKGPTPDIDAVILFGGDVSSQPSNRISHHLRAYTGRQLSFETDILDAITGVLSRSNLYSYSGLPFLSVPNNLAGATENFVKALCWRGSIYKTDLVRRHGFPSWSWASWKGRTYCSGDATSLEKLDQEVHHVKVWIESSDHTLVAFGDYLGERQAPAVLLPLSPYIHLDSVILKLKIQPRDFSEHGPLAFEPWICHCHPTDGHPLPTHPLEAIKVMNHKSGVNFLEEHRKETLRARDYWECILLYEHRTKQSEVPLFNWELLVLEYSGESMTRVGSASIRSQAREWFDDLCAKAERRRVRLG